MWIIHDAIAGVLVSSQNALSFLKGVTASSVRTVEIIYVCTYCNVNNKITKFLVPRYNCRYHINKIGIFLIHPKLFINK